MAPGSTVRARGSQGRSLALRGPRIHNSSDNPRSRPKYNLTHGSGTGGTKDQWAETQAEVLEKYPGYDWVEYEDCYTDDWGDEYCEYWYELDCWTDLDVSYSVDNTTPQRLTIFQLQLTKTMKERKMTVWIT